MNSSGFLQKLTPIFRNLGIFILLVFIGMLSRWVGLGLPGWEGLSSYWVSSDGLSTYCWINVLRTEGWFPFYPITSARLSFPEGLYMYQAPMTDSFHWILILLTRLFFDSSIAVYNLYFIFGAGAICASMAFVCRSFGLSWMISAAAGLIFSALPFGFERQHHLFLSAYFDIPLGIFLAVNLHKVVSARARIAVSGLLGMTGLYYTYFTCSVLCVLFVFHVIRFLGGKSEISIRTLTYNLGFSLVPALISVALALIPTIHGNMKYGKSGGMERNPQESIIWGLRPQNIFMPPTTHLIPAYESVKPAFFSSQYLNEESVYEGYNEYIGLLAMIGLVIGFAFLFRSSLFRNHKYRIEIQALSVASIWLFLLGLRGGIGYWVASTVSPQIRSYNRVSVVLAGLGLVIFFMWFSQSQWSKKWKANWILIAVLLLSFADLGSFWRPVNPLVPETQSDQQFSRKVKESVGDSPVIKFPFGVFPEWPGYPSKESYAAFRFLAFEQIHSIFPVIKGTPTMETKVRRFFGRVPSWSEITEFGLRGVVIDRLDYEDQGREAIQSLSYAGAVAFDSPNGRFHFIRAPN